MATLEVAVLEIIKQIHFPPRILFSNFFATPGLYDPNTCGFLYPFHGLYNGEIAEFIGSAVLELEKWNCVHTCGIAWNFSMKSNDFSNQNYSASI
jgi:hypothetical protein